ncbi:MAG TPA: HemK/PrmC family methyltransferase [Actinomycetota bacterium]|nr:HemK/PrmC family methyltransferase [Actinomycetota bacterium]
MKARALIRQGTTRLKDSPAIDHWQKGREKIEAEILLFDLLGEEPDADDKISAKDQRTFEEWIERRYTGEPVAHITGTTEFKGLDLIVEPGVFVPRDSSEWLAEQAIRRLRKRKKPVHVDLASGMGTIALAVSSEVPKAEVFGAELSTEGVKLARRNAKKLGVKAQFGSGDLFGPVPKRLRGKVDVITIHPPYVANDELDDLPDEIRDWEPAHTLTDRSPDGLGLVRRTVDEAPDWLKPNGWVLMETDPDRARDVRKVMAKGGFRDVTSTKGGPVPITRVIVGKCPR